MAYLVGAVLVLLLAGAIIANAGGALLGHLPGWFLWLVPIDPHSLTARLIVGAFVIGIPLMLLYIFCAGEPPTEEERRRIDRDADDFAWWMTFFGRR